MSEFTGYRPRRGRPPVSNTDAVYDFIVQYTRESKGMPPSLRAIQLGMGLRTHETVRGYVQRLVTEGRIERVTEGNRHYYRIATGQWQNQAEREAV